MLFVEYRAGHPAPGMSQAWREALTEVNRALSLDGEFLPALSTKTLLLYGSKQYSAAYELSSRLASRLSDAVRLAKAVREVT